MADITKKTAQELAKTIADNAFAYSSMASGEGNTPHLGLTAQDLADAAASSYAAQGVDVFPTDAVEEYSDEVKPVSSKRTSLSKYYDSILGQLNGTYLANPEVLNYQALGYEMPTEVEIAQKISEYLRPNYDRAISSRRAQTTQNRAALDIDAASRGMGSSTWLTDAKNRQALAEAADIAGLESDYDANLAQSVYSMYNQHLNNKLNVDMFDKQNQLSVDQQNVANKMNASQWLYDTAYARALDAYDRKLKI